MRGVIARCLRSMQGCETQIRVRCGSRPSSKRSLLRTTGAGELNQVTEHFHEAREDPPQQPSELTSPVIRRAPVAVRELCATSPPPPRSQQPLRCIDACAPAAAHRDADALATTCRRSVPHSSRIPRCVRRSSLAPSAPTGGARGDRGLEVTAGGGAIDLVEDHRCRCRSRQRGDIGCYRGDGVPVGCIDNEQNAV